MQEKNEVENENNDQIAESSDDALPIGLYVEGCSRSCNKGAIFGSGVALGVVAAILFFIKK